MLGNNQLLELVEVRKVHNGASAGQTTITPTPIDMAGFDGIAVLADLGTVTDACVLNLKLQQGDQSGGGDAADILDPAGNVVGTGNITAASDSNKILAVDVVRPTGRYVTPVLARGTQNAVVNTIIALLYRSKEPTPVTQGATIESAVVKPAA